MFCIGPLNENLRFPRSDSFQNVDFRPNARLVQIAHTLKAFERNQKIGLRLGLMGLGLHIGQFFASRGISGLQFLPE